VAKTTDYLDQTILTVLDELLKIVFPGKQHDLLQSKFGCICD